MLIEMIGLFLNHRFTDFVHSFGTKVFGWGMSVAIMIWNCAKERWKLGIHFNGYIDAEKIANEKGLLFVHLNVRSLINKLDIVRHFLLDTNRDCLCLMETWLRDVISDNLIGITVYRPPKGKVDGFLKSISNLMLEITRHKKERTILHGDFNINYLNPHCKWAKELRNIEMRTGLHQIIKLPTRISQVSSSCIDLCFTDLCFIASSGVLNVNLCDHFPTYLIRKKKRE